MQVGWRRLPYYVPIINWVRTYQLTYLVGDLLAGLTIGILLIPQGLAYSQLAKVPYM